MAPAGFVDATGGEEVIDLLLRPFTTVWQTLVSYHRAHLADDPDVKQLREQKREAQKSNQRLNVVESKYLKGRRP